MLLPEAHLVIRGACYQLQRARGPCRGGKAQGRGVCSDSIPACTWCIIRTGGLVITACQKLLPFAVHKARRLWLLRLRLLLTR